MLSGNYDHGAPGSHTNGLIRPGVIDVRGADTPEQGGAAFFEYLGMVKRGKWWLLAFGILGAAAGFVFLLYQPSVYRATTYLELQGFNESFMGMNVVDPMAGSGNYTVNQANINTQLRIIERFSERAP